jgi:hypothetical protein
MITWYGYRCDHCGERFIRFSRYFTHVANHLAVEQEKFLHSIFVAWKQGVRQNNDLVHYLFGRTG